MKTRVFGFALPTILIASLIMLMVLSATLISVNSTVVSMQSQSYEQMVQNASEAGIEYAEACLRANNGVVTWSEYSPLSPGDDCNGSLMNSGLNCDGGGTATDSRCFVSVNGNIKTTFSVGPPDNDTAGVSLTLKSTGSLYVLRTSDNAVWRTYTKNTTKKIVATRIPFYNQPALELDANNLVSYPGGGATWYDISGNNSNATLYGSPVANTYMGISSIKFDGTTSYIDFSVLNLPNGVATIEFWAKIGSSAQTNGKMFFGWGVYGLYSFGGQLGYNTGNSDLYGMNSTTVNSLNLFNKWHHYVCVMYANQSYTNNKIYIDGVEQPLSQLMGSEYSPNRNFNNGNGRIPGWRNDTNYSKMLMNVGLFNVYSNVLSEDAIKYKYNSMRGRYEADTAVL